MQTVLVKNVFFYQPDGTAVVIQKGSQVLMDEETGVGFFEGLHFDLLPGEFEQQGAHAQEAALG
jgi:hypothetical protein